MHVLNKVPNIPPSVNPMEMSDEEFAKYRKIGDDIVSTEAATAMAMMDHKYIQTNLALLSRNDQILDLQNVALNKEEWDVPESSDETWKKMGERFMEEYFNDLPVDSKNRPRKQLFLVTDEEKVVLKNAAEFFCIHMTEAILALAVRSLLKQYAAFNATQVLVKTKLIDKHPHRRIIATMKFVLDVMDSNSFEPEGRGIKAVQKLRLVHAIVRDRLDGVSKLIMIKKHNIPNDWDEDKFGSPINQQDMLFAVHTFSIEVIKGLEAAGEKLSEADIKNYYYAWHIIGRLLGVWPALNPTDYHIGVQVQERIYAKEFIKENPNGPELAAPLIKFLDTLVPKSNPKRILSMVKLFNDKKDYDKVFKDILQLDLSNASDLYIYLYKIQDFIKHVWIKIRISFKVGDKRTHYLKYLSKLQHELFQIIVSSFQTWTGEKFPMEDAWGPTAAMEDEKLMQKETWSERINIIITKIKAKLLNRH